MHRRLSPHRRPSSSKDDWRPRRLGKVLELPGQLVVLTHQAALLHLSGWPHVWELDPQELQGLLHVAV